ncbi:hypothetical protein [Larkinella knui]|nr:hypothetical protein [Larkinella knui]
MLLILLIPAFKVLDYAYEQSVRFDSQVDAKMTNDAAIHTDMYLHNPIDHSKLKPQPIEPSSHREWIAKGLVVSMIILIAIGLVRGRPR